MKDDKKHNWVTYYNPRNGRVRVSACSKCGIAKNDISGSLSCFSLIDSQHAMKKMGWEELPKFA